MKIEKINDNQIRCTLTHEDLANRELKLSELAYGTEKAKSLFRDMMQQASYEFGFETEDIPLMIEAIPLSADCIILIITKVEDPDELDTRFSKFNIASGDDSTEIVNETPPTEGADGILELYRRIQEEKIRAEQLQKQAKQDSDFVPLDQAVKATQPEKSKKAAKQTPSTDKSVVTVNMTKLYRIGSLDMANRLANVLNGFYHGENTLYKNPMTRKYFLIINKSSHTPEEFNKVCNILAEYGVPERFNSASEAFFNEHYELIIKDSALQILANL